MRKPSWILPGLVYAGGIAIVVGVIMGMLLAYLEPRPKPVPPREPAVVADRDVTPAKVEHLVELQGKLLTKQAEDMQDLELDLDAALDRVDYLEGRLLLWEKGECECCPRDPLMREDVDEAMRTVHEVLEAAARDEDR